MIYPNLFKSRYTLRGRDWIKCLSPDDRVAFIWLGLKHADFGRLGGKARANTALRDSRGRFIKNPPVEIDYGDMHT